MMNIIVLEIISTRQNGVEIVKVAPVADMSMSGTKFNPNGAFYVTPEQMQQMGLEVTAWKTDPSPPITPEDDDDMPF